MELAPPSPCSYRRVLNRKRLRTQSRANSAAKGTAQTHHGRRRSTGAAAAGSAPLTPAVSGAAPAPGTTVIRSRPADMSDGSGLDGRADPRDDLVQHGLERGGRFEAEHPLRLVGRRDTPLDVVFERVVVDGPQRDALALDLAPDGLG